MISLFLCNSFTILFEFKHDEFEREQEGTGILGFEPAPHEEPQGKADKWGRPAYTYGQSPWPFCRCAGSM